MPTDRSFKTIQLAIDLDRELLYERINKRVDWMLEAGLEAEVVSLRNYFHLNALQTVGYKEWLDYFDQKISKEECIEAIKQHSRNYAKRQITWFKRDKRVYWLKDANAFEAINYCKQIIAADDSTT
jgi:tRNA dimethylallyltransferase